MKIIILLPDAKLGGAQNVMLQLADEFAVHHHIEFLYLVQAGDLHKTDTGASRFHFIIEHERLGLSDVLEAFHSLIGIMRTKKDMVILSTGTGTNLLACAARLFAPKGAGLVIREACSSKNSKNWMITLLKRLLYPRADGMIGVSDGVTEELKVLAGKSQPIISIPNPIDIDRLQALAEEQDERLLAFPHPYLLTVGRLVPQKNTAMLIDAYAKIEAEVDAHLVVIGTGPLEAELNQRIARYRPCSKIHLLGEVTNPHPWYKRASMFVLSSDSEGYPNVLLEALAHGLPVVSTDCDFGPRQILGNSRYGQLVRTGDVDDLANAIRATLNGTKVFDKWDIAHFNVPATAKQYLVFMESCSHG